MGCGPPHGCAFPQETSNKKIKVQTVCVQQKVPGIVSLDPGRNFLHNPCVKIAISCMGTLNIDLGSILVRLKVWKRLQGVWKRLQGVWKRLQGVWKRLHFLMNCYLAQILIIRGV